MDNGIGFKTKFNRNRFRPLIDIEGVEVDGTLVKPQGSLLLERKHAKFNPMIKLRTDFDDEMDQSVKEIK